jgi:N-formylglutamate amidohydrolase
MLLYELFRGDAPLVIDVPHAGRHVPDAIALRLTAAARAVPDTDWHVERLYAFARSTGATLMWATHSRYVVDLNLGTASGASCAPALQDLATGILGASPRFTHVVNGRFKGGWITRRYGRPEEGMHALQLEMAQEAYMDEGPPYAWNAQRAGALMRVLERLVVALAEWRPASAAPDSGSER